MPRLSKIGAAALAAFGWTSGSSVTASYLVVGGGGGGGNNGGGGGGAGAYRTGTASLNPTLSYTVTVGAGGTSGVMSAPGGVGGDSTFNAVTSNGGGGGGGENQRAATYSGNGSGGGGQGNSGGTGAAGGTYGNAGGNGTGGSQYRGGGGGGAGAAGTTGSNSQVGNGGNGTASSISGSSVTYAGGGGGSKGDTATGGAGGTGGGGSFGQNAGTANLGGGGGGGDGSGGLGGAGGSGVVIISYVGAQQFGGGVVTSDGTNTIHTFTTSGTLSPLSSLTASTLVVAGGGGGSGGNGGSPAAGAGGGGAGGYRTSSVAIDINSNYVVTVGAGGAAGPDNGLGVSGSDSAFFSTTSTGGGRGGSTGGVNGLTGGSGGGGQGKNSGAGGAGNTPSTSPSQGSNGGAGGTSVGGGGGGGGGATATGTTATSASGGAGGAGTASSLSGASVTYAGGGGGGNQSSGSGGTGGSGGGGAGGTNAAGTAGTANLGGGGGGGGVTGSNTGFAGGAGGSGIVIISYPGATQQMAGGTVTISGGNVIHTFTSSGYLTPIKFVGRSLRFRSSATAYLSKTFASAGNTTTFTYSAWVKRGQIGATNPTQYLFWGGNNCNFGFGLVGTDDLSGNLRGTGGTNYFFNTSAVFRDPSAWYHIVWAVDTTQATDTNRLKLYVNGVQQTLTVTYPPQNTVELSTAQRNIGAESGRYYFDGYMTEVNFIDGQALTPSSFGTVNSFGVWQPITYGGSYGTNGFYLTFGNITSTTTLGYDTSPQGNNWTTNNISLTAGTTYDSMTDVPTLTSATVANYPTWNPLTAGGLVTFSEANLKALSTSASAPSNIETTMKTTTGKWYAEVTVAVGANNPAVGIGNNPSTSNSNTDQYAAYRAGGTYITSGMGASSSGTPATFTTNDVIGIAYDVAAGTLVFYKNGTLQTGGFTGITAGSYSFIVRKDSASGDGGFLNCGQRPFTYTAPSGFVALNTYNLSTPTIPNGATQFAATLYTGNGSTQSITNTVNGVSFQPDWVWVKIRSAGATDHYLADSVRGATKYLQSNTTAAEGTNNGITAFNSNGFSVGAVGDTNSNTATIVGWQWNAGGSTVTNTSGTISAQVRANTTAGFSVVTYTGTGANATVGHGLGVVPSMMIFKNRTGVYNWAVYHASLANASTTLDFTTAAADGTNATTFNATAPTSSVFSLGTNDRVNRSTNTFVAYVFAPIAGYSAFGSYTGNGSADGTFVFLGFEPRWVMIKRTDTTGDWQMYDTSRAPINVASNTLYANGAFAEDSNTANRALDLLSNGFKLRASASFLNASGGTYIYMAFAESPFKFANAR